MGIKVETRKVCKNCGRCFLKDGTCSNQDCNRIAELEEIIKDANLRSTKTLLIAVRALQEEGREMQRRIKELERQNRILRDCLSRVCSYCQPDQKVWEECGK